MAGNVSLWSTTALTNTNSDADINWAEGQLPGTVNGSARGMMAAVAGWYKDTNGTLATTGSANAYAVTNNVGYSALATGIQLGVKANHSNTGASTLVLTPAGGSAFASKAIRVFTVAGDVALSANMIRADGQYQLRYDAAANGASGAWILLNPSDPAPAVSTTDNAVARFDGTAGALQNSSVVIDDSNNVSGVADLANSGVHTVTSASASALAVGRQGATTPALQVDASTGTSITGVKVTAAASGGGVAVAAVGETNVALKVDGAGTGSVTINGTGTGAVILRGTATNDSASAGFVGEYMETTGNLGATGLTTDTAANFMSPTSLTLTPGDWDVTIKAYFLPAATTTVARVRVSLSTTSATENASLGNFSQHTYNSTHVPGNNYIVVTLANVRVSLAANTAYYPVALATFGTSTLSVGGVFSARRRR